MRMNSSIRCQVLLPVLYILSLYYIFELRRSNLEQILREEKDDIRTEDLDRFPLPYGIRCFENSVTEKGYTISILL